MRSLDNLNNYNDTFPKVLVPVMFSEVKNQVITFKDIYPNYKIPRPPKSIEVIDDNIENNVKTFVGCGFLGLVLIFFLTMFITTILGNEKEFWAMGGRTIILVGALIIGFISVVTNNSSVQKHRKLLNKTYTIDKEKYLKEEGDFQALKVKVESPNYLYNYRLNLLNEKLKNSKNIILRSCVILEDYEIKKGPSEELFYSILKKYTDYQIYKSLQFQFYYPDLVLIKDNVVIDVEIDEPYVLSTKEPIHYDDIDFIRDKYFYENNILVIRFTEEQVLSDPLTCIDIINEIHSNCLKVIDLKKSTKYQEFEVPNWTHEMAFQLAYNDSRANLESLIKSAKNKYLK